MHDLDRPALRYTSADTFLSEFGSAGGCLDAGAFALSSDEDTWLLDLP
jgi:hypothetical protein